ncbi:MAG: ABC transporter permease subunit [Thermoanaerobaculia bacterium]
MSSRTQRLLTKLSDKTSTVVITGGGLMMIGSLILIFFLILSESLALFRPPRATLDHSTPLAGEGGVRALGALPDDYREAAAVVLSNGAFRVVDLASGAVLKEFALPEAGGKTVTALARGFRGELALGLEDGRILLVTPRWRAFFEGSKRNVEFSASVRGTLSPDPLGRPVRLLALWRKESGAFAVASAPDANTLFFAVFSEDEPGATAVRDLSAEIGNEKVSALALDEKGAFLEVGTDSGKVLSFDVEDPSTPKAASALVVHPESPASVTSMASLIGGQTLVVGDAKGRVTGFGRQRTAGSGEAKTLSETKRFATHGARVVEVAPSPRGKTFLTGDETGRILASFATNERLLVNVPSRDRIVSLAVAPKADGFLVLTKNGLESYQLDASHPEISWRSLFGKQLYEGYDKPEYVWQSTGATDDFESKMSLVPLIFGTLKGTLYALIFAIPIALSAALYTSVFAPPTVKAFVKPVVEIMAALPSVVLGFLGGLWLAPVIQTATLSTLILFPAIPLAILAGVFLREALPYEWRQRVTGVTEVAVIVFLSALAAVLCFAAGPALERILFSGDFKSWLFSALHLRYDARNSVVIAFAMGFAVIPIIFTISEDALSSVPQHLKAASLALGASPWQTATRVILPTASAGIFSALMVGFGRAVGETMIVLMATGNTPIMEWSPFNGMRTLSANIAVEISEAPQGGTLYRVLFLSALLLFVLTFLVNTLAEVMRQRLRKKYSVI